MRLVIDRSSLASRAYAWGRAHRGEMLLCARVQVTIGHDGHRLGLAPRERRYVTARFADGLDPTLCAELAELLRRRGMAARRVAETLDPIELVIDDQRHGRQRIIGRLEPPHLRCSELREIEFAIRELTPVP
jgi:hypothetical protein